MSILYVLKKANLESWYYVTAYMYRRKKLVKCVWYTYKILYTMEVFLQRDIQKWALSKEVPNFDIQKVSDLEQSF